MNKINYIDLFAGAGGLSEGFTRAGFQPIAHVEADKAACLTLKTRAAYFYLKENNKLSLYYAYLRGDIQRDEFYSNVPSYILNSVLNAKIGEENKQIFRQIDSILANRQVDLIIGGPPCQAYSIVGRAPLKHKMDDERTKLYVQYGRFLKRYNPSIFIFENVPGLLSAADGKYFNNLKKYYKSIGYNVEARLLDAYDYGVIQRRERVIIIGWKKQLDFVYPELVKVVGQYSRDDIFYDLPHILPAHNQRVQKYSAEINSYLKKSLIRNGVDFVSQHIARPHNEKDLAIYKLAIDRLKQGVRLRNCDIPLNMRTQKNITSFLDRFKVVDLIPHTVIAHIAKDGHHFIHPDCKQLRSISVREAARIQSFPDDYYFEGVVEEKVRSAAFKQIGNAVPPLLAEKIAQEIMRMMKNG